VVEVAIDADAWYNDLTVGEQIIDADSWYNPLQLLEDLIEADSWYNDLRVVAPEVGVGVAPTDLIYLSKLYEIRVYIGGGANWNYTRYGLKDVTWMPDNPWVRIPIPGGAPRRQHLGSRSIENGVLRCLDDKAFYSLFMATDVRSDAGNQYLIGSTSYAASKVVFVYKGNKKEVSTGNESEVTVWYTFTNFRAEAPRSMLDENNEQVWEIGFNADSVERTEI
jgi:hypothetical protein